MLQILDISYQIFHIHNLQTYWSAPLKNWRVQNICTNSYLSHPSPEKLRLSHLFLLAFAQNFYFSLALIFNKS